MIASLISTLVALAKAVPALTSLCEKLIDLFSRYDSSRNEQQALDRKVTKDQLVDDTIDRVRSASTVQQRTEIDAKQ